MSNVINSGTKIAILGLIVVITFGIGMASEVHQAHAVIGIYTGSITHDVFAAGIHNGGGHGGGH